MSAAATRECRRCRIAKPWNELKRDGRNGDGYSSFCKKCHAESSTAWQRANRERVNAARRARYAKKKGELNAKRKASYSYEAIRWDRLFRLYRITRETYESALRSQGGACAICRRDQSLFRRAFAVDHSHACCPKAPTCGRCTRGLLCHPCNTAMHSLERDKEWTQRAIQYLGGR